MCLCIGLVIDASEAVVAGRSSYAAIVTHLSGLNSSASSPYDEQAFSKGRWGNCTRQPAGTV